MGPDATKPAPQAMPQMRATPRSAPLGAIADALSSIDRFANVPDPTDPTQKGRKILAALSNMVGVGDMGATADRMSYGLPLTEGTGMARQMLPETKNALLSIGPNVAKYPKQAMHAAMAMNGLGDMGQAANRAAIVYHGSPHKFDKFDSSKIGTGEGAQAYGHGLYLAESPDVAKSYQTANVFRAYDIAPEAEKRGLQLSAGARGELVRQASANPDPMIAARRLQYANASTRDIPQEKLADLIKGYQDAQSGAMYKVDLPDEKIARMLDWDKPVSEAQRKPLSQAAMRDFGSGLTGTSGEHLYKEVVFEFKNAGHPNPTQAATDWLRANNVPGIRYLDGGSRGAGAGTSNFVVFPGEENALTILERNGAKIGR